MWALTTLVVLLATVDAMEGLARARLLEMLPKSSLEESWW
jgi:hypothetical protein